MAEQVVRTNIVNFFKNTSPSPRITTSAVSDTLPEAAKRSPADRGGDKGAGPAERAIPPEKGIRPGENRRGGAGLGRLEPAGRQPRKKTDPEENRPMETDPAGRSPRREEREESAPGGRPTRQRNRFRGRRTRRKEAPTGREPRRAGPGIYSKNSSSSLCSGPAASISSSQS